MEIPFVGGAYEQRSLSINAQRSINCFPVVDKNDAKTVVAMYGTPGLKYFTKSVLYSGGADGDATISEDTTLTRDMYYDNLVVNSGVTLNTAGFTVQCKTLLTNNGVITDSNSGGSGGTSTYQRGGKGGGRVILWAKEFVNNGLIHADGEDAGTEEVFGADGGAGGFPLKLGAGYGGAGGVNSWVTGCVPGAGGQAGTVSIYYSIKTVEGTISANPGLGAFGNGVDGSVTISTSTTLTADMNYVDLTVNSGQVLNTAGYKVRCTGVLTNNGTITDSTYQASGGVGAGTTIGGHRTGIAGTAGGNGIVASIVGAGNGGAGGASGGSGAGSYPTDVPQAIGGNGGAGGAGGIGGGRVLLYAKYVYNYGVINVKGSNGSNGSNGTNGAYANGFGGKPLWVTGGGGGGRGGNGGNGGTIIAMCNEIHNIAPGVITYSGGNGGTGGVHGIRGTDTAVDGSGWSPNVLYYGGAGVNGSGTGGNGVFATNWATNGTNGSNGEKGVNGTYTVYTRETTDFPKEGAISLTEITYGESSNSALRGGIVVGTNLYLAVGANIIKVTSAGITSLLGGLTTSTGNVFMASNGIQILIVDGTASGHYITIASDDTIHDLTDENFVAASSVTFMDGFFIVSKTNSGEIYISSLYAVDTWDAADSAVAEGSPDNLVRIMSVNNTLWLFGEQATEVWYNSGAVDFPFVRISGALLNQGVVSAASIVLIDSQFVFLSNKREILVTSGYQFDKISTIHIDKTIQEYATVHDAVGWEYRFDGHIFYVLTFPTEDATWVYDFTTGFWHEWQSYKTVGIATFGRHRTTMGFYVDGKYIVGDYANGTLYELGMEYFTDDGEFIKRIRRTPYINKEKKRVCHYEINVEFEPGVGLPGTGIGSNPQVGLTWSDDGGNNWATVQYKNLGSNTDYYARQRWLRLGMSRNRIYELTMYEPVKFVLLGANANIEGEAS